MLIEYGFDPTRVSQNMLLQLKEFDVKKLNESVQSGQAGLLTPNAAPSEEKLGISNRTGKGIMVDHITFGAFKEERRKADSEEEARKIREAEHDRRERYEAEITMKEAECLEVKKEALNLKMVVIPEIEAQMAKQLYQNNPRREDLIKLD